METLRRALLEEWDVTIAPSQYSKPLLCRLHLHHHWKWQYNPEGQRYRRCTRCGRDHMGDPPRGRAQICSLSPDFRQSSWQLKTKERDVTATGLDVIRQMVERTNAHDLEGMAALMHEDYQSEQPFHPARGFGGRAR